MSEKRRVPYITGANKPDTPKGRLARLVKDEYSLRMRYQHLQDVPKMSLRDVADDINRRWRAGEIPPFPRDIRRSDIADVRRRLKKGLIS